MKIKLLFLLLILLIPAALLAQTGYTVKGVAADDAEHVKLVNASISILSAKDSTLVSFARAAEDGSFSINGLRKGKFIILMVYPRYADYVENFELDSVSPVHNFGLVNMQLKERLLKEVMIKGTATAIKIKGDTTEFNASAYTIQPNSKVEDLLKQLPGIQIDKDGKITAQGQTVTKVLVDGEEFFGDDPTLVTKNIHADMVDKVQLYDKKSDQAAFTGVDDGKKTKTINIKLKEGSKNGMFGKALAGGGSDGYYQEQLLFNAFKPKQKFSVYGTTGNDGKIGLGWEDNQKYGSNDDIQYGDNGEIYFMGGSSDDLNSFSGYYNGQGLPVSRTGGIHYDGKWNSDKESINANYKTGSLSVDGINNTLTQNNLPGSIINSTSNQGFHNFMFKQKLDANYQVKLDTTSNLKITADVSQKHSTSRNSYTAAEMRNDTLINNSTRDITNTVDQSALNASAFYTKKFKKKGRTLSFSVKEAYSESKAKGYLKSDIRFYNALGQQDSSQLVDQYKTNDLKSFAINTNLTYSEPLSKTFSVVLNYGISTNNSSSDRKSFNPTSPGNYTQLVDSLSSNYKLNQFINLGGIIFNYKKGKTIVNFGTHVNDVNFHQLDEYTGDVLDRHFINWAPQASYEYRFSQQKSFWMQYNGSTTQPTLEQIQPLRVNNDPLNIVLGNPDLRPSFSNNFTIAYNSFRILTSQYLSFYSNYSFTINPIVSDVSTDPVSGKSISRYLNLSNKQTSNFYFGSDFSKKIEKSGLSVGVGLGANGSTYFNLVNDEINMTRSYTFNPRLTANKSEEKKYQFYVSAGPKYTISQSSLQPLINNNGFGFKSDGQFTVFLPGKFQIASYSSYEYTAKTASFNTDFSRALVNASIAKTFLKGDNLRLELWGNDLLNQNVGFNRTATSNLITQNSYTTIKRYFMFTVTYDFTKMASGTAKK